MEIILIWVVLSAGVGYIAHDRRRSGVGWFLLSLLLSPLIGLIGILVVGPGGTPAGAVAGVSIGSTVSTAGYAQAVIDLDAMKATGAIDEAEYDRRLGALKYEAATGQRQPYDCGRCGKPLSPYWKYCQHCKATFVEFPPAPRAPKAQVGP